MANNTNFDPEIGKATQFQPGQSGNPAGPKPGYKHLKTHIEEMLNDENFGMLIQDSKVGWKQYEGVPIRAIIETAIVRARSGEREWADWLAKYAYGTTSKVEENSTQKITIVTRKHNARTDD